jgi:hypothetical protein
MNLKHRVLLLLYKYPGIRLPELKLWLPDVKCEVVKAELIRLYREGLIDKAGKRGKFRYNLSEIGRQYIEHEYLKHRFYELKIINNLLFADVGVM